MMGIGGFVDADMSFPGGWVGAWVGTRILRGGPNCILEQEV